MACQIVYNDDNTFTINAPNGEESVLFQKISELPEITDQYQALEAWLKIYTETFKDWYGVDWENISDKQKDKFIKEGYLDVNGEPSLFYRGDYSAIESFTYSNRIGKFGQGIYIASQGPQAELYAKEDGKDVFPVFLRPGKSIKFADVTKFKAAVSKFNNITTAPTDADIQAYVATIHSEQKNIIGKGVFGNEYNVYNKANVRSIFSRGFNINGIGLYDNVEETIMSETSQKQRKSNAFITALVERLSKNTGIKYNTISEAEAKRITAKADNKWKGQPAFFFNGEVYFVGDRLTYSTAIHEFAHPFVRAIAKDNPGLFNKIFEDIAKEEQGQGFLAEALTEYPTLTINDELVREETIVKAMTYVAQNNDKIDAAIQPSKGIVAAIKKFFYALKQALRKIRGKANLKNLSENTTIRELSEMMVEDSWGIDFDLIKEEDIVAYMHETKDHMDHLLKLAKDAEGRASIYRILEENADLTIKQMREMKESDEYENLKIVLSDVKGNGDHKQMMANMRNLDTKAQVDRALEDRLGELEEFKKAIQAFSFNLIVINDSVDRMKNHIAELTKSPDPTKALSQTVVYTNNLDQWRIFLERFLRDMENKIPVDSPVIKDVIEIKEKIDRGKNAITTIYRKATREILSEVWAPLNENLKIRYDEEVADTKKKMEKRGDKSGYFRSGVTNKIWGETKLAKLKEDFERDYVDKDKMEDFITGQMGDIGSWHAWFESFNANQDPAIASFAMFVKKHMSEVNTKVHRGYNDFVNEFKPLVEDLGVKPSQILKFQELFLFTDTSYKREENEIVPFKVHTLLNRFKEYKYEMAIMHDKLSKAKAEFNKDPSDANAETFATLAIETQNHKKFFFHNVYNDDYYHADDMLDKTAIGRKAKIKKDSVMAKIEFWQRTHEDDHQLYEDYEKVELLWRDYSQLFSLYDNYGELKKDVIDEIDPKKSTYDLSIAKALREHREAKRKFYEYNEIEGAFQISYKQFIQKETIRMTQEKSWGNESDSQFKEELGKRIATWLKRNTQVKIKDSFYEVRERLLTRIGEIMAMAKTTVEFDVEWETILDSLQGRRDNNGQPVATEMTEEHLAVIKALEEKMHAAKQKIEGISGLTPVESAKMSAFYEKQTEGIGLTEDELAIFNKLRIKKNKLGLNKGLKDELFILFDKLEALQSKLATDYYLQVVNNYHQDIVEAQREGTDLEGHAYEEIDHGNVDLFSMPSYVNPLMKADAKFAAWFKKNHILKDVRNDEGKMEERYVRTYAWSVVKPNDEKYLKTTEILNTNGTNTTITGVPTIKYFSRDVKKEFYTGYNKATDEIELKTGVHKDAQGRWLPKGLDEMEVMRTKYGTEMAAQPFAYDHYINRDYDKLKVDNPAAFKMLELLTKFHLKNQEHLHPSARLGLELPRFRRDLHEYALGATGKQEPGHYWDSLKEGWQQLWSKRTDDAEDEFNYESSSSMHDRDIYATDTGKIPIRGKYLLDEGQVSLDVIGSLMMYYQSAETNTALRKIQPVAKAMKSLSEGNPNEVKGMTKKIANERGLGAFNAGDTNNRSKVINSIVEVGFEGKKLFAGSNKNAKTLKVINNMLGMASHTFFAFDITSALKNHIGAQFQIALEGAGGKYFNYKDWQLGRPWAAKAMWQISGQVYSNDVKSLDVQLIDLFDAVQGRFDDKFGESLSRSFGKDAANLTWTTSHRKWLETEATLQLFSAMMGSTRVEQKLPGQEPKKIKYIDAWELDPETKQVRLKEGIDKVWDIDGAKFNSLKFRNHEVSNLLQGAYASMEQPMVNRYMVWRLVSSMRKFFTKMAVHRYGVKAESFWKWSSYQERYNLPTEQMHMGYYMRNLATIRKMWDSGFQHAHYMSKEEWRALRMQVLEFIKIMLLSMSYSFIFGFDPDDDDKWKKLRGEMDSEGRMDWLVGQGSGALPHPFVDEEWSDKFNMKGWIGNQILLLSMHVEAENEHFIPLPGYGLKDMAGLFSDVSIASGPSLDAVIVLFYDIVRSAQGRDMDYKNDVGALKWEQEGSHKFKKHFMRIVGVKGKFMDPISSLRNFKTMRDK